MLAGLLIPVEAQSWLPITEIESIEVFMESLFGFLSTLELHPRFFNARIARESFEQYERLLVSRHLLSFAGDRERCGEGVELRAAPLCLSQFPSIRGPRPARP